jgi:adenylate cyclase
MKSLSRGKMIVLGNLLIVLLCLFMFSYRTLGVMSDAIFDFNMENSMSHIPHEDILVIGIDSESLKEVGPYPWDRKVYAKLINQLEQAGAKVIGFDIMLDSESTKPESDAELASTLSKYNNVILPTHLDLEGIADRSTKVKAGELIMAEKANQPIPMFNKNNVKAHINAAFDKDGVIRYNWLQINSPDGVFSSLGFAMAQKAGVDVSRYLELPTRPNHPKAEMIIKWDAYMKDFETVPFSKVLNGQIPASTFKDRLILVGSVTPGTDDGITPIEKHMPLVYAHATILNQLLENKSINYVNPWIPLIVSLVLMALIGLVTWRLKATTGITVTFLLVGVLFVIQFYLFSKGSSYLDVSNAIAGIFITYLGNISLKTYFETKQKNYITKQFGRYISPDLVKEIANSESEIQLGGISKELTILFLDVRGFTPLSERLKPEEVVDFLNMMFNLITERALENHGTIDKFIGDAAMILYNAPLDVPDHPYYAVKTAYEIQKGMEKVRADVLEKYGVTISVGIGINTGDVVVGNIGSYLRVDYTAIGDNVNTAARIESNTQPNQVLVSEVTYELTKDYFEYNFAGEKLMKGKSVPLKLFEVLGVKNAPASAKAKNTQAS